MDHAGQACCAVRPCSNATFGAHTCVIHYSAADRDRLGVLCQADSLEAMDLLITARSVFLTDGLLLLDCKGVACCMACSSGRKDAPAHGTGSASQQHHALEVMEDGLIASRGLVAHRQGPWCTRVSTVRLSCPFLEQTGLNLVWAGGGKGPGSSSVAQDELWHTAG